MSPLRFRILPAAVVAAVIGCSQPAQQSGPLPRGTFGDTDPVAAIIERRPELSLADSQVAILRLLKRDLDRVNRPLREELEKLGLMRPVENARRLPEAPTREQQEKAKPIQEELRANNKKARDAAMEILTATQRTKLDSLEKLVRSRTRQDQRRREQPPE